MLKVKVAPLREVAFRVMVVAAIGMLSVPAIGQSAGPRRAPTVVEAVAPTYPGIALAMPKGGDVAVAVFIGPGGSVEHAEALTGAAPLRHPAVAAARLWRFTPEDVGQRTTLNFSFRVMRKDTPVDELTPVFKPPYGVEVRRTMPKPVVNYGGQSTIPRPGTRMRMPEIIPPPAPTPTALIAFTWAITL